MDAAHDPWLPAVAAPADAWRLTVIATSRAGYYDEIDAVRDGTAQTVSAEEVILGWQEQLSQRVLGQLGGFPAKGCDPDARQTVTLTDVTWIG